MYKVRVYSLCPLISLVNFPFQSTSLSEALMQFTASKLYTEVEVIKVIVKQLQAYKQLGLKGDAILCGSG